MSLQTEREARMLNLLPRSYRSLILGLSLLLSLSACPGDQQSQNNEQNQASTQSTQSQEQSVLRLGFTPSENTHELQENAQPLVDKLEKELGIEVQAVLASDYTGIVEAFRNNKLDVAFLSPASYVMAHNEAQVKVLLKTQRGNSPFYRSVIFTHKDSPIQSIQDLKGKTFAFGDPLSTAGTIFPKKMLHDAELNPEVDFEKFVYSGGHDATVLTVHNQKVDAGATYANDDAGQEGAWVNVLKAEQQKDIRVVAVSEPIPADNLCVHPDLAPEMQDKIKNFFTNLTQSEEGKKLVKDLYRIDAFVEANDKDYEGIREAFAIADIKLK